LHDGVQTACTIVTNFVKIDQPMWKYHNFWFFKSVTIHHVKSSKCLCHASSEELMCIRISNFIKNGFGDIAFLSIFLIWHHHWFFKCEHFIRWYAHRSLCQISSKSRGRDIAIFRYVMMAAVCHLGFVCGVGLFGLHVQSGLIVEQNWYMDAGEDSTNVFYW